MLLITRMQLKPAPGVFRLLPVLALLAMLRVVLEEKPKGGEAKQQGLEEPQAACGHVRDAFVTARTQKRYKKVIRYEN